jgi:predicted permease
MDTLLQDLKYAARQLWRSPAFTAAAVATLALGIGANTALFTLGQAILVRPMPGVMQSDRLLWVTGARRDYSRAAMSYPDFVDYRDGLRDLVELAAVAELKYALGGRGEPERVRGEVVSGNYFSILRTPFALGRGFSASEDSLGNPRHVAVISHGLWQRRFDGDSGIVGREIVINGQPLTVIGVTMEGFNGAELELPREVWLPMALIDVAAADLPGQWKSRGNWWLNAIGRLRPGVAQEQVLASARTIAGRIAVSDSATHKGITANVYPAKSGVPPGSAENILPLTILAGVVTGLVLLIACANVSNLLLARAVSRRREVGIRLSLGASRRRLVRQLLTDSIALSAAAGSAGILLAYWSTEWLVTSGVFPLRLDMTPDRGVIAFTVGAAALASLLFGLVPALEATRGDIVRSVQDGTQGRDPRRARLQSGFVVAQLALSLVLLTTAGLFLRSMYKARNVEIGFEATSQVLAMSFDLGLQRYSDARADAFMRELDDRTKGMPGVEHVSFTDVVPMGQRYVGGEIVVEGVAVSSGSASRESRPITVFQSTIRPGYFETLGVPIVRGRDFRASDDKSAPPVVIVSAGFARETWPHEDPIGKRVSVRGDDGPFLTIVGVAQEVMLGGPTESKRSVVYLPQQQYPESKYQTIIVRTAGKPEPLAEALRREIRSLDPNLPVYDVRTLAEYKRLKLADRMNGANILGGFGALALLLASIGVYGVMAFSVLQRTKEIGIRVALGARGTDVIALFVGRGMRLILIGVAIGMTLSLGLSQLLQGMLFGLMPTDAVTFVGVAGLLAGVALLASWLPARRASRVDPIQALRYE